MFPPEIIDPNDTIKREQHFISTATQFLSTLKLNLPKTLGPKLRTQTEIENCNKVKIERKEDRKDKMRERIFKRKPKQADNKIKMEDFVGDKEYEKVMKIKKEFNVENKDHVKFKKGSVVEKKKRLGKSRRVLKKQSRKR